MIVTTRQIVRDGSGNFGCPNCWRDQMGVVNPRNQVCPRCGVALEWPREAIDASRYWAEIRAAGAFVEKAGA